MKTAINTPTIKNLFSGFFIAFALFLSSFSFAEKGHKGIDDGVLLQKAISLQKALLHDRTELALEIIKRNPKIIYFKYDRDRTLLHTVAWYGSTEMATLLLDIGADVDAKDDLGKTPLHNIARYGSTGMATLLLDRGADVDAKDGRGWSPLHNAAWNGRIGMATLLLDRGADADARDNEGYTPLDVTHDSDSDMEDILIKASGCFFSCLLERLF